jgi:hypothetical protein
MTKQTWSAVKSTVSKLSRDDLLSLVAELYRLSKQNQNFLHARFANAEAAMEDCKKIIAECLYPDVLRDRPLQVAKAKAVADPVLHADLMLFFVEQGNAFTLEYGDIDAGFYNALLAMGRRAVKTICSLPKELQEPFRERLSEIVLSSSGIGWGYHDELAEIYDTAFPEED